MLGLNYLIGLNSNFSLVIKVVLLISFHNTFYNHFQFRENFHLFFEKVVLTNESHLFFEKGCAEKSLLDEIR